MIRPKINGVYSDIGNKSNRKIWILRIVLFIIALLILYFTLTKAFQTVTAFFEVNTIRFYQPVTVQVRRPMEIVSRDQVKREKEFDNKVNQITDKCMESLKPTPTIKQKDGIVKQVKAADNVWHYLNYSDRPAYSKIMADLKIRYKNWQSAAELIAHEGMFQPEIKNPTSGACGLPQALPCSKMECPLNESGITCQLDWMEMYVGDRYGTVTDALAFRMLNGWY